MPEQWTEDDFKKMIADIVKENEGCNFGVVMKQLAPKIKGKFDGKQASALVKGTLEG